MCIRTSAYCQPHPRSNRYCDRAVADSLTHLALTDTSSLYGAVQFSNACQAVGIQPIIGMSTRVQSLDTEEVSEPGRMLVLLATGQAGYRSLCRLSSQLQARPDREERMVRGLDWATLKENADGIICLSGGRQGWIECCLRAGENMGAARYAGQLGGIFGSRAYLSLELHGEKDHSTARAIMALGNRFGLRTVAVQPVYTMLPSDRAHLRLLRAIDRNCPLTELPADAMPDAGLDSRLDGDETSIGLHWLSPAELTQRFDAFPDALAAVEEITSLCQPALPDSNPIWPRPALPSDIPADTPVEEALSTLAAAGLADRYAR